jgi:hypothetical protein
VGVVIGQRCDFPGTDVLHFSVEAPDGVPIVERENRWSNAATGQ